MVKTNRRNAAFMLVDTIAALTLLVGGVTVALMFFRAEVREVRGANERVTGLLMAQSEIERLITLPFAELSVGANQPLQLTLPSTRRLKAVRGTLSVKELAPGLKEATVRIVWDTPRRYTMEASLTRLFAREEKP